jgi:hypothetical protein
MAPVTLVPSSLVRVTEVSVPPLTEARIGAIGLTAAAPEAGTRVTIAGGAAAVLAEVLDDVVPRAGLDEVVVGPVEVDRCPVGVAVQAARAMTATVAAAAHRVPPATASSEATTTRADGAGPLIVTIRSAIPA